LLHDVAVDEATSSSCKKNSDLTITKNPLMPENEDTASTVSAEE
jgi:hypothetical protein